jgi:hypothetical protein
MNGGVIEALGASVLQRRVLFYGVCVPLRLVLAASVTRAPRWLVVAFACASIVANIAALRSNRKVWWCRPAHLAPAVAVLALMFSKNRKVAALVAVADVVFGVGTGVMNRHP